MSKVQKTIQIEAPQDEAENVRTRGERFKDSHGLPYYICLLKVIIIFAA